MSHDTHRQRDGIGSARDTLVSAEMLHETVRAVNARVRINCRHDVPYLGGCSRDGKTVYIDRHVPKTFSSAGHRATAQPFIVLHEAIERSLLIHMGLKYQYAHQLALRAEQAAIRAAGLSWHDYNRFCQQHLKTVDDERIVKPPVDLDLTPYRDEHDPAKLRALAKKMRGRP